GLGGHGQGGALQGTRRAGSVNENHAANRCDVRLAGRTARNAEPVDPGDQDNPQCAIASSNASF
ncbi:MAG TPA: hypothetical protein VGG62_03740, partial [Terracidiphilus sp.]